MEPVFFKNSALYIPVIVPGVGGDEKAIAGFAVIVLAVNVNDAAAFCDVVKLILLKLHILISPTAGFLAGKEIRNSYHRVQVGEKRVQIQHKHHPAMLFWYKKRVTSYIYNLF